MEAKAQVAHFLTQKKNFKIHDFFPFQIEVSDNFGFDTCGVDRNLVALSTTGKEARIFDLRVSKIASAIEIAPSGGTLIIE